VLSLVQAIRERSIAVRAEKLTLPPLNEPARIRQGAGNYDAMCAGCHLAPGVAETELSKGLYPAPPNLTREKVPPSEAFWAIKHGITASGMPAWGKSMNDEYIWNMVAFLQQLPKLDADGYRDIVAHSEGHSHGGGEGAHHHRGNDEGGHDEHDEMEEMHGGEHEHQMPASASTVPAHGQPGHHH
jgi:mono/diheme cytochrome c family protein